MDRVRSIRRTKAKLRSINTRRSLPIHGTLRWTRASDAHNNTTRNHHPKCHRHNKYLQSIRKLCLLLALSVNATPVLAQTDVGGVSATANPVANSSGSVTNQAIQVLQGPYITNTYGDGIQCQGPTMNVTPYVTRTGSWQDPYEGIYQDPVYNNVDANDDGVPDNPGEILYYIPTRTGQKSSQNINVGLSATFSFSLDKKAQQLCKEAATLHNQHRRQVTANKRLDFEIARLKNCGELMKAGIMFHPRSPYASVCADVVLVNPPNVVGPHNHSISSEVSSSEVQTLSQLIPSSSDTHSSSTQIESDGKGFFQGWRLPWSKPSLSQDETPSAADQLGVLQVGHWPPQQ